MRSPTPPAFIVALLLAILFMAACTYGSTNLTGLQCDQPGERRDGQVCLGGYWVLDDTPDTHVEDTRTPEDVYVPIDTSSPDTGPDVIIEPDVSVPDAEFDARPDVLPPEDVIEDTTPDARDADGEDADVEPDTDPVDPCVTQGVGCGVITTAMGDVTCGPENCVKTVAAGDLHTCLTVRNDDLYCWGNGDQFRTGHLGGQEDLPVRVENLKATKISAAANHTCLITALQSVECFGGNDIGQIGLPKGEPASQGAPHPLTALANTTTKLVSWDKSNCAVQAGDVKCWGDAAGFELGHGSSESTHLPQEILQDVRHVALGRRHGCAMKHGGEIWCWGSADLSQYGHDVAEELLTPVHLENLSTDNIAISAGAAHSCVVKSNGSVWCWGSNSDRQLGASMPAHTPEPIHVAGLNVGGVTVEALALGRIHSCALNSDGEVWCWGGNNNRQLGNGGNAATANPTRVQNLPAEIIAIAAGTDHTCAIHAVGELWCWGLNNAKQLGVDVSAPNVNEARRVIVTVSP
ncbi:MAG: RCC1 domain-containing protein [Bradymonadaceae bacterium]